MPKLRLLKYTRVSTKKQLNDGTMKNQERSIKKFMEYNSDKYEIVGTYKDEGISAVSFRPDYEGMIISLFNDNADGIIIQRLDRVGRSVKQLSELMVRFNENGKTFIATEQNINTSTIEGKLFFHILAAIAEFNSALIKERMAEGKERYLEEGGVLGRHKIEFDNKTNIKIKKYYEAGLGLRVIKNLLKIDDIKVSEGTIRDRLVNLKVTMRPPKHRKVGRKINYKKKEI